MGLVCTFGLVGNILSFITFGRMRQHNATVVLFRALAIADSLMLLSVMIYYVPSAFATYMEYASPIFRTVQAYLDLCFSIVLMIQCNTIWIAVLLAVNRYIAVCKPLMAASICTVGNARKQLCFALVLSLLVILPQFFKRHIAQAWYQTFCWVIYMLFFFIIPFVTILILGIKIILKIHPYVDNPIRIHQQQNTINPVTRLVFAILLVFLLCETPAMVAQIVIRTLPYEAIGRCGFYFFQISNFLGTLNSGINLPIYLAFNKTFRKTLCMRCWTTRILATNTQRTNDLSLGNLERGSCADI